jgi:hypothetical protein
MRGHGTERTRAIVVRTAAALLADLLGGPCQADGTVYGVDLTQVEGSCGSFVNTPGRHAYSLSDLYGAVQLCFDPVGAAGWTAAPTGDVILRPDLLAFTGDDMASASTVCVHFCECFEQVLRGVSASADAGARMAEASKLELKKLAANMRVSAGEAFQYDPNGILAAQLDSGEKVASARSAIFLFFRSAQE